MDEEQKYRLAKERVEEIKGFYTHVMTFVGVNAMLIVLNLLTSDELWFYWVSVFWGLGLLCHAVQVFFSHKLFSKAWEEKKIRELMDKEL